MTALAPQSPKALSLDNLSAYLQWVHSQPKLDAAQERSLLQKVKDGDAQAAKQIIFAHIRYVVYVVRQYRGYGLSEVDLIQEGTLGLMKALKRFKTTHEVRFISYAIHWVKAGIRQYILEHWHLVKVATTKAQRKLFFNLRSKAKDLSRLSQEEANLLATELGVSVKDVFRMQTRLLAGKSAYDLNASTVQSGMQEGSLRLEEKLADQGQPLLLDQLVQQEHQQHLHQVLAQLGERDRLILELRWLSAQKVKLHDVAKRLGVSAERVRQLEKRALQTVRELLLHARQEDD
jgi:RNA polymerase sigma-32 factor